MQGTYLGTLYKIEGNPIWRFWQLPSWPLPLRLARAAKGVGTLAEESGRDRTETHYCTSMSAKTTSPTASPPDAGKIARKEACATIYPRMYCVPQYGDEYQVQRPCHPAGRSRLKSHCRGATQKRLAQDLPGDGPLYYIDHLTVDIGMHGPCAPHKCGTVAH